MGNWVNIVKTLGPVVVTLLNSKLVPVVSEIIAAIIKAEATGGNGQLKLQSVVDEINSLGSDVLSSVSLEDLMSVVSAVVQVANIMGKGTINL